jgi:tetratricopeptide (TPR) repeat protein
MSTTPPSDGADAFLTTQANSPALQDGTTLARGTLVDRYVILERIGGGGMGVVYAAYDPQLDRKLAIKLVRYGSDSDEDRNRLLREAQAMARVSHPNVLAVHDAGTFEDQVFVAVELVDGLNLRNWMQAAQRPWREVVQVFLQAGRGLAAAHRAGIVHRDFKPENVVVDGDGRARVLDFGLAHALGLDTKTDPGAAPTPTPTSEPNMLDTPLTRTGALLGTPAYMAPEQILARTTDERTDLFSFCVALYEGLYGQRPFAGDRIEALNVNVLSGRVREAPKDSPVPARVRALVLRGLQVEPAQRPPSMDALLSELALTVADRRRWAPLLAVGGALTIAIAAVLGSGRRNETRLCQGAELRLAGVWDDARRAAARQAFASTGLPDAGTLFDRTRALLDRYAQAWTRMHVESCEATRVRGEQSEDLLDLRTHCLNQRLDELRAFSDLLVSADAQLARRGPEAASALSGLDHCADVEALRAPVRRPTEPKARATLERLEKEAARTNALEIAGRYPAAKELIAALLPSVRDLHYRPLEADLLRRQAVLQSPSDKKAAIHSAFDGALAAQAGHDDLQAAQIWSYLVFLNGQEKSFEEAHRCAQIAEALLERTGHPPREESIFYTNLGDLLDDEEKWTEAAVAFRRSLDLDTKSGAKDKSGMAVTLNSLAGTLRNLGLADQALAAAERALRLAEEVNGPTHPTVAMAFSTRCLALLDLGRIEDAANCLPRSLEIDKVAFGPNSDEIGEDLSAIADSQVARKQFVQAEATAREAIAATTKPGESDMWQPLEQLARAQLGLHKPREAIATFQRLLRDGPKPGTRSGARVQFGFARALWETGAHAKARALATQAQAVMQVGLAPGGTLRELRELNEWLSSHSSD